MCGIFCIITQPNDISLNDLIEKFAVFESQIKNRGPNYFNTESFCWSSVKCVFAASILWLQGNSITKQPIINNKSIFIYNGDIFGGILPEKARSIEGDTNLFIKALENSENIPETLQQIEGPYAFVYLDKVNNKLYFCRDIFGRRSLLIGKDRDCLIVTSVAKRKTGINFMELPSIGLFEYNLSSNSLQVYLWYSSNNYTAQKLTEIETFLSIKIVVNTNFSRDNTSTFIQPNSDNFLIYNEIETLCMEDIFRTLITDVRWKSNLLHLNELLENSVRKRIDNLPKYCKNCINNHLDCNHSTIGILFSGGVDCAILALISDNFIENRRPIDLINVSFDHINNFKSPDRLTGLATLKELQDIRPERQWNFIEINVDQVELEFERELKIADLIYPLNTVLDESLGCALWFASRAESSPSRVLLVGMGADELFGGYTRHRNALKRTSWQGLHRVLGEDFQKLPYRNLGRDDRVISDHGRQLRTPYLDEDLVRFVRKLNCWEKTRPTTEFPEGVGEKILLRTLAYHLGLTSAACLKKRALQFGSRIANSKEKGDEISSRLT